MSTDATPQPIAVTLVHSPACHFCDDAEEALHELSAEYAIDVSVVYIDSRSAGPRGRSPPGDEPPRPGRRRVLQLGPAAAQEAHQAP